MTIYDKVYKACSEIYKGQHFEFLKYDQYVRNPKIINHIVENKDTINNLYLLLKNSKLATILRNPKGSIARHNIHHAAGAWDVQEIYTAKNVFKGIIITVIVKGYVFVFKCGTFSFNNNQLSGYKCFAKFATACKNNNVDLQKYATDDGLAVKAKIESPIIQMWQTLQVLDNVHHIDLNQAWPSQVCAVYPEFKPVFAELRQKDKLIADIALGFCQSEHINYKYAELAKIGINGCNKQIKSILEKLIENDFEIIGINTDGIWYKDKTSQNRLYHDEDEGTGLGQWKTDHKNCTFCAYSDGQYWFEENGKFNVRARGYYSYEQIKPRENWNREDFDKAMYTQVVINWNRDEGFIIYGEN